MSNLFVPFFGTELLRDDVEGFVELARICVDVSLFVNTQHDVDDRDFVSSSLMLVPRDAASAYSCAIDLTLG